MKDSWRVALAVVVSIGVLLGLLLLNSFYWSPLGAVRNWVFGPNELGRFLWEAGTGAPMGGLFAIAAAGIAYLGITQTLKRTDKANENAVATREAAENKAAEDQWWSVLQWAYEQASKEGDAANTFKDKAVLGIFESLAVPGLSDMQQGALDRITAVFEKKQNEFTRAEVSGLRTAVDAAKHEAQSSRSYRIFIARELSRVKIHGLNRVFAHGQGAPLLFETNSGSLLAVLPLHALEMPYDQTVDPRPVMRERAHFWRQQELTVSDHPGALAAGMVFWKKTIDRVIFVTNVLAPINRLPDDPMWVFYPQLGDPLEGQGGMRPLQLAMEEFAMNQ